MTTYLDIKKEVQQALNEGKPVVALESTIISHGMPYPKNVETALAVEEVIRQQGAVPATIAIIDGVIKVGLTREEIEFLGTSKDVLKVSRRDMPLVVSKKMHGATTVAGTMIAAAMAGIKVFVTGGIGGVHRGAQETMDISADLDELAKTNVTVICAGPKAILDLPVTLELLESKGVPVIGYNTDCLPAFYTRTSPYQVDFNATTPKDIAKIHLMKRKYHLDGGLLITNPIPAQYAMDEKIITKAINQAQKEMEAKHIKGKDETPFLLARIVELTHGNSLETNIQLVLNNAKLGAQIAKEYCAMKK